jgi:hypothetical protein
MLKAESQSVVAPNQSKFLEVTSRSKGNVVHVAPVKRDFRQPRGWQFLDERLCRQTVAQRGPLNLAS